MIGEDRSTQVDSLVLRFQAGSRVGLIEISRENGEFLIRIPGYNIVDLLPTSQRSAARIIDALPEHVLDRDVWTTFLTNPLALETALGLSQLTEASNA